MVWEIEPKFRVGAKVRKLKGYRFAGEVRAVFTKTTGETRIVVENGDGMLHIFNEGQMEHDSEAAPSYGAKGWKDVFGGEKT